MNFNLDMIFPGLGSMEWLIVVGLIIAAGVIFKKILKYAICVAAVIFIVNVLFPIAHEYMLR